MEPFNFSRDVGRIQELHKISLNLVRENSLYAVITQTANVARQLTGARFAAVGILGDSGKQSEWQFAGFASDDAHPWTRQPQWENCVAEVFRLQAPIRQAEVATQPQRANSLKLPANIHSFLGIPILAQNRVIGQIDLMEKEGSEAFTATDQWMIEILAAFSAVAIENARSYARLQENENELAQRNRELAIFNDVSVAASTTLELEGILATTLDRMRMHFNALNGAVFLAEEETNEFRIALQRGTISTPYWEKDCFSVGEGIVGRVAASQDLLAFMDPSEETGFNHEAFLKDGLRMLLGIPLVSKGRVLGVMILALQKPVELTLRQKALFEAVGLSVGTAVENGLLHRKSQRLAVLEERERIGMDLHDGIIQSIYAVGLLLEEGLLDLENDPVPTRAKLERSISGLNAVIRDIRAYINDLQPKRFIFDNLAVGLDLLVKEFLVNTPVMAETELSHEAGRGLAPAMANALFHIAQEALANVTRHAHATRVRMTLAQVEDRVVLEVADDGQGFDPAMKVSSGGHGLINMEERARGVRGDLKINSEPGQGTRVLASIPRIRPQTGSLAGKISRGTGPMRRL